MTEFTKSAEEMEVEKEKQAQTQTLTAASVLFTQQMRVQPKPFNATAPGTVPRRTNFGLSDLEIQLCEAWNAEAKNHYEMFRDCIIEVYDKFMRMDVSEILGGGMNAILDDVRIVYDVCGIYEKLQALPLVYRRWNLLSDEAWIMARTLSDVQASSFNTKRDIEMVHKALHGVRESNAAAFELW